MRSTPVPGARVQVEVTYTPDEVIIFVDDDGKATSHSGHGGARHGLLGMRDGSPRPAAPWKPAPAPLVRAGGSTPASPSCPCCFRVTLAAVADRIRIIVVDDQALVRSGFRLILEGEDDFDVVGETGTAWRASSWPNGPTPTSSSWTSACPGWTAWRPPAA